MTGLEEAVDFAKGNPRSTTLVRKRSLPEIDIAQERKALNLTQKSFASILGVSSELLKRGRLVGAILRRQRVI